jgi:hypothetical protein
MKIRIKKIAIYFLLIIAIATISCAGNLTNENDEKQSDSINELKEVLKIEGAWRLKAFDGNDNKNIFKNCDANTIWNFTNEADSPLGDGTSTQKLIATAPSDCNFFGFESSWTLIPTSDLFIKSTRIGGIGGVSLAGTFKILEHTETSLILKSFNNIITLEKELTE